MNDTDFQQREAVLRVFVVVVLIATYLLVVSKMVDFVDGQLQRDGYVSACPR